MKLNDNQVEILKAMLRNNVVGLVYLWKDHDHRAIVVKELIGMAQKVGRPYSLSDKKTLLATVKRKEQAQ